MRRLTATLTTTLVAILSISATSAATASAVEGMLPINVPLTITSGITLLMDVNGNSFACTSDTILGAVFTTDTAGTFTDLHCKGAKAFGLFSANSPFDEKEVILWGGGTIEICLIDSVHLVFGAFMQFQKTVVVEVPAAKAKIEIKGSVVGTLSANALSKTKTAKFSQSKGAAGIKECKDEKGGVKKAQLLASLNGGAFVEVGVEATETLSATNGTTELELMDI